MVWNGMARNMAWHGVARLGNRASYKLSPIFLLKSRTFQHSRGVEKYYPPAIFPLFPEYRLDFSRFQRKIKALRT